MTRRGGALFVIVAACFAACGGAQQGQGITSGSRLRARWQVAGGAQRLVGWHDNQLGLDCGFEQLVSPSGKHACLPHAATIVSYFSDASCTTPIDVAQGDSCTTASYAIRNAQSCSTEPAIFELGAQLDASTLYFVDSGGAGCTNVAAVSGPFHALGASVPLSTFVGAHESHDESGQVWLVADDGARMPWGGFDGTRAVQPTLLDDGVVRWAPWHVAYQSSYTWTDATCTTPAATKDMPAQCPPDAVLEYVPGSCGQIPVSFAALGTPVSPDYVNNVGPCSSETASNRGVWTIGDAIPTPSFLEAGDVTVGSGAVQVRYATMRGVPILQASPGTQLGGNGPLRADAFVDAASGMVCDPTSASDGKLRCIPRSMGGNILFTDAACTNPVFAWGNTCAAAPSVVVYPTGPFDACGPSVSAARAVLGTTTVTTVYFLSSGSSGTCMQGGISPTETLYALGPELPPDAFAEVTEKTD